MCAKSRYIIEESANSFQVRGRPEAVDVPGAPTWLVDLAYEWNGTRRNSIRVVQHPFCLEIIPEGGEPQRTDFCDFRHVLSRIVDTLMSSWEPPGRKVKHPWVGAKHWAHERTRWALCSRIHAQWLRLLARVDPTVLAVHRKVFAANFGYQRGNLHMSPELYQHKYLVKDILQYRAAAMAVTLCRGYETSEAFHRLSKWQSCYVPDGYEPYTSLRKTLTTLPGGVGLRLMSRLRDVVLPRPIYSRLELLSLLVAAGGPARHFGVIAHATEEKIKAAVLRVFEEVSFEADEAEQLSLRRGRDVEGAINYLLDYPGEHNGKIGGLARRAIIWHRDANQWEYGRQVTDTLGGDRQCALPPIEPPTDSQIRFLSTVDDVVEEGRRMRHCVASYAEKAVDGRSFLFHIEYAGSSASVEVDRWGRVRQSLGPRNSSNAAADWGRTQLAAWGAAFSQSDSSTPMSI